MADPKKYKICVEVDEGIDYGGISLVTIDALGFGTKVELMTGDVTEIDENTKYAIVAEPKLYGDPDAEKKGVFCGFWNKVRNRKYDFMPLDPETGEPNPEYTFNQINNGTPFVWNEKTTDAEGKELIIEHEELLAYPTFANFDFTLFVRFAEATPIVEKDEEGNITFVRKSKKANQLQDFEKLNKAGDNGVTNPTHKYILDGITASASSVTCSIKEVPSIKKKHWDPDAGQWVTETEVCTAWDENGHPLYGFTMVRAICIDKSQGKCMEVVFGDKESTTGSDTGKSCKFVFDEAHQLTSGKWQVTVSVDNGWDVSSITKVVNV